jgi:hypothetical protein
MPEGPLLCLLVVFSPYIPAAALEELVPPPMEALAVVDIRPYLTYFTFTEEPVAGVAVLPAAVGAMVVPGGMAVAVEVVVVGDPEPEVRAVRVALAWS